MIRKAQMQTVFSSLRWYAADRYGLLIAVGCVGGNFNQTVGHHLKKTKIHSLSGVKYTLQVGTVRSVLILCTLKHFLAFVL